MRKTATKQRRQARVRRKLRSQGEPRLRLSVFRSARHIYAQLIDDGAGQTVAAASTMDKGFTSLAAGAGGEKSLKGIAAAEAVGKLLAQRAKAAGKTDASFDRGAYLYHGRVKALAEGARAEGMKF